MCDFDLLSLTVTCVQESSNVAMETKDSAKTKRAPRKKYRWNEETRSNSYVCSTNVGSVVYTGAA